MQCTGANDFIPWLSVASLAHAHRKKAIIIAPDYPLGPEGNYQDIVQSIKDFLDFYKKDVCFEEGIGTWSGWLLSKIDKEEVSLDLKRIYVEGESAGGLAAATALFLNADKKDGTQLKISVALLRYPMIEHYAREYQESLAFVGVKYPKGVLEDQADKILEARRELEELGLLPTRGRSSAPQCMSAAFLLSVLGRWKESFQRQHKGQALTDRFDIMDGLERAKASVDRVDHELLPPIFMYHGEKDTNCAHESTTKFRDILVAKYSDRYTNKPVVAKIVAGKPHAFDYELKEEDEEFLKEAHDFIDDHWKRII